ncbi:hypothetical protein GGE29_004750 [Agrobacterium tumefaciens]|nr:hypothetical protein [Agrobacterium radiobacter]MBB4453968.1 hypothetical protein [Agrobacterium radiobacter]
MLFLDLDKDQDRTTVTGNRLGYQRFGPVGGHGHMWRIR